ncbi:MAG TPA: M15 family metallopeptidase, partial [Ktedonobacteraceae bacterium]|nr:M15 family metallopeptidase [Ktedonobacteraceae bacterium]
QVIIEQKFLITSVIPVADPCFHWDDELSMQADNTSGFNYRTIACTNRLSNHADGRAIDINPFRNPYIRKDLPHLKHGGYNVKVPGTIIKGDKIVSTFEEMGWIWGGNWEDDRKDYQHFEKPTK